MADPTWNAKNKAAAGPNPVAQPPAAPSWGAAVQTAVQQKAAQNAPAAAPYKPKPVAVPKAKGNVGPTRYSYETPPATPPADQPSVKPPEAAKAPPSKPVASKTDTWEMPKPPDMTAKPAADADSVTLLPSQPIIERPGQPSTGNTYRRPPRKGHDEAQLQRQWAYEDALAAATENETQGLRASGQERQAAEALKGQTIPVEILLTQAARAVSAERQKRLASGQLQPMSPEEGQAAAEARLDQMAKAAGAVSWADYTAEARRRGIPLDSMAAQVARNAAEQLMAEDEAYRREANQPIDGMRTHVVAKPPVSLGSPADMEKKLVREQVEAAKGRGVDLQATQPRLMTADVRSPDTLDVVEAADATGPMGGPETAADPLVAKPGEVGYQTAERIIAAAEDHGVTGDYINAISQDPGGYSRYIQDQVPKILKTWGVKNTDPDYDAQTLKARRQALNEVVAFKTVGVWTPPILISSETNPVSGWDAFWPKIEVVGYGAPSENGKPIIVTRQQGITSYAFDVMDFLQMGAVGAWKYGQEERQKAAAEGETSGILAGLEGMGRGAVKGIGQREDIFTAAMASPDSQARQVYNEDGSLALDENGEPIMTEKWRPWVYGTLGLAGAIASPDLAQLVVMPAASKLLKKVGTVAEARKAEQAAKLLDEIAAARRAGGVKLEEALAAERRVDELRRLAESTPEDIQAAHTEARRLRGEANAILSNASARESTLFVQQNNLARHLDAADAAIARDTLGGAPEIADPTVARRIPGQEEALLTLHPSIRKPAKTVEVAESGKGAVKAIPIGRKDLFDTQDQITRIERAFDDTDPARAAEIQRHVFAVNARPIMERVEQLAPDLKPILADGRVITDPVAWRAEALKAAAAVAPESRDAVVRDLLTLYRQGENIDDAVMEAKHAAYRAIMANNGARATAADGVSQALKDRSRQVMSLHGERDAGELGRLADDPTVRLAEAEAGLAPELSEPGKAFEAQLRETGLSRSQANTAAQVMDMRARKAVYEGRAADVADWYRTTAHGEDGLDALAEAGEQTLANVGRDTAIKRELIAELRTLQAADETPEAIRRIREIKQQLDAIEEMGQPLSHEGRQAVRKATTAREAALAIAEHAQSPYAREIAQRLVDVLPSDVSFQVSLTKGGQAGEFKYGVSRASMDASGALRATFEPGRVIVQAPDDVETMLHEFTHAATANAIHRFMVTPGMMSEEARQAVEQLAALFNDVKGHPEIDALIKAANKGGNADYGLTDVHEFIAEAFANPDFQEVLRKIPASELLNPPAKAGILRSVYDSLRDIVRQLLGIKPTVPDSALDAVMDAAPGVFKANQETVDDLKLISWSTQGKPFDTETAFEAGSIYNRALQATHPDLSKLAVPEGFFSPLQKALGRVFEKAGDRGVKADYLLREAMKQPGVKADELEWSGIAAWLQKQGDRRVTSAEVAEEIAKREPVVQVVGAEGQGPGSKAAQEAAARLAEADRKMSEVRREFAAKWFPDMGTDSVGSNEAEELNHAALVATGKVGYAATVTDYGKRVNALADKLAASGNAAEAQAAASRFLAVSEEANAAYSADEAARQGGGTRFGGYVAHGPSSNYREIRFLQQAPEDPVFDAAVKKRREAVESVLPKWRDARNALLADINDLRVPIDHPDAADWQFDLQNVKRQVNNSAPYDNGGLDYDDADLRDLANIVNGAAPGLADRLIHFKNVDEARAAAAQLPIPKRVVAGPGSSVLQHFEPNTIAHLRTTDRVGPNGERILFVEEVQSDWHQAGKKHGYKNPTALKRVEDELAATRSEIVKLKHEKLLSPEDQARLDAAHNVLADFTVDEASRQAAIAEKEAIYEKMRPRSEAISARLRELRIKESELSDAGSALRQAPNAGSHSELWRELALKQALNIAAREGYDGVALTRGEIIQAVVGGEEEGQQVFYDTMLPKTLEQAAKEKAQAILVKIDKDAADQSSPVDLWEREVAKKRQAVADAEQGLTNAQRRFARYNDAEDLADATTRLEHAKIRLADTETLLSTARRRNGWRAVPYLPITPDLRQRITDEGLALYSRKPGATTASAEMAAMAPSLQAARDEALHMLNTSIESAEANAANRISVNDLAGKKAHEVAAQIATTSSNPVHRHVAERVGELLERYNIPVAIDFRPPSSVRDSMLKVVDRLGLSEAESADLVKRIDAAAPNLSAIDINGRMEWTQLGEGKPRGLVTIRIPRGADATEHAVLHEFTHAVTLLVIHPSFAASVPEAAELRKTLSELLKEAKKAAASDRFIHAGVRYGLTDEREFVAEAMSNPVFQNFLRNVETKDRQSLWTRFVDGIASFFGYGKATKAGRSDLMTETSKVFDQLLSVQETPEQVAKRLEEVERGSTQIAEPVKVTPNAAPAVPRAAAPAEAAPPSTIADAQAKVWDLQRQRKDAKPGTALRTAIDRQLNEARQALKDAKAEAAAARREAQAAERQTAKDRMSRLSRDPRVKQANARVSAAKRELKDAIAAEQEAATALAKSKAEKEPATVQRRKLAMWQAAGAQVATKRRAVSETEGIFEQAVADAAADLDATEAMPRPKGAPRRVVGFTTEKGSTYTVNGSTTQRTKAKIEWMPGVPHPLHEGDSGLKKASEITYYADDEYAGRISAAGLEGVPRNQQPLVIIETAPDGTKTATGVWWNTETGTISAPMYADMGPVRLTTEPAVGRTPIELWSPRLERDGAKAYGKVHVGHPIVELHYADAAADADATEAAIRRAPAKEPPELTQVGETPRPVEAEETGTATPPSAPSPLPAPPSAPSAPAPAAAQEATITLSAFSSSDPEMALRDLAGVLQSDLTLEERRALAAAGLADPTAFANAFIAWVKDPTSAAKAVSPAMGAAADWLRDAFRTVKAADGTAVSPEVSAAFSQLLGLKQSDEAIEAAKQAAAAAHEAARPKAVGFFKGLMGPDYQARRLNLFDELAKAGNAQGIPLDAKELRRAYEATGRIELPAPLFGRVSYDAKGLADLQDKLEDTALAALKRNPAKLTLDDPARMIVEETAIDKAWNALRSERLAAETVDEAGDPIALMTRAGNLADEGVKAIGRFSLTLATGQDEMKDLRHLAPQVREPIVGAVRVINIAYADAQRIMVDRGIDGLVKYLMGERMTFRGGRRAVSSGWDSASVLRMRLMDAVSHVDSGDLAVLTGAEDLANLSPEASAAASRAAADLLYRRANLFTKQLGEIIGISQPLNRSADLNLTVKELLLAKTLTIYTRMNPEDGLRMLSRGVSGLYGPEAGHRVLMLMAGHGQLGRLAKTWHNAGLLIPTEDAALFKTWLMGEQITEAQMKRVAQVADSLGFDPNFVPGQQLLGDTDMPKAAHDRLMSALTKATPEKPHFLMADPTDLNAKKSQIWQSWLTYLKWRKSSQVRGSLLKRTRFVFGNSVDQIHMTAARLGLGPSFASAIRTSGQYATVLAPGVQRLVDVAQRFGLTSPDALEKMRDVVQSWGDTASHAFSRMVFGNVTSLEMNKLMDGADEVLYIPATGQFYHYGQLRQTFMESGVSEGLAKNIESAFKRSVSPPTDLKGRAAERVASYMEYVEDCLDAVNERERFGQALTLVELGVPPRMAGQMTTQALFDYTTSMTGAERSWLMNLFLPYWAFTKNATRATINSMFSPWQAHRLALLRRATEYGADAAAELAYGWITDPYGIDVNALTEEGYANYLTMRETIEGHYGGVEKVPMDVKMAVRAAFGGNSSYMIDKGRIFEFTSRVGELLRDTQADARLKDADGHPARMDTESAYIPRPDRSGEPTYTREFFALPLAIPLHGGIPRRKDGDRLSNMQRYMDLASPDHPFIELLLPETYVQSGLRQSLGVAAGLVEAVTAGLNLGVGVVTHSPTTMDTAGQAYFTYENLMRQIVDPERALVLPDAAKELFGMGDPPPYHVHAIIGEALTGLGISHLEVEAAKDPFQVSLETGEPVDQDLADKLAAAAAANQLPPGEEGAGAGLKATRHYIPSFWGQVARSIPGFEEFNKALLNYNDYLDLHPGASPLERAASPEYRAVVTAARGITGAMTVEPHRSLDALREEPRRATDTTKLPERQ